LITQVSRLYYYTCFFNECSKNRC